MEQEPYYEYSLNIMIGQDRREKVMANTEYITIENASRKVLKRMRQIGVDKAQRLQKVQERWDAGEYRNAEIVQL